MSTRPGTEPFTNVLQEGDVSMPQSLVIDRLVFEAFFLARPVPAKLPQVVLRAGHHGKPAPREPMSFWSGRAGRSLTPAEEREATANMVAFFRVLLGIRERQK
jgi:hypothetical protein